MASASGLTALSWRPLPLPPLLRPASNCCKPAAANRFRIFAAISTFKSRAPPCGCRTPSLPVNFLRSPFVDGALTYSSLKLESRWRRRCGMAISAGMNLNPGGGNNNNRGDGGIARTVANVVLAGALTYLTLTGKLGWIFDTIISLWLLAVSIPVIGFIAFLWFAEREIVRGACPNCGQAFQVFEFAVKEQPNLCPYCSQPFKLDSERQFVRDEPRFSSPKSNGFKDGFGGFGGFGKGGSSTKDQDPGGVVVDVEAEVFDRE